MKWRHGKKQFFITVQFTHCAVTIDVLMMTMTFERRNVRNRKPSSAGAVKSPEGARLFARGLYDFLHGRGQLEKKFERWCEVVGELPRRQTRVLTWPVVTVFGFIASPETQIFLKPNVTREAAGAYGFDFRYNSRPGWETYASLLEFADVVRRDLREMRPKDLIDIQSFIWVLGSNEY
jgi:hypothetical protein